MPMRPRISLTAATGLVDAIRSAGADPDQTLRPLGLDPSALSNPDGFMACADFARALEAAARATGDECFGLHFGERYQPQDVGALAYVAFNSPTIAASIANVARYLRVHNEAARVSLVIEGVWASLRHELVDLSLETARQHAEYSMAIGRNAIRLMVGSQWTPIEVQFAHRAPREASEHVRVFGAPVSFDCAANAFVMGRAFLDRQVPAADERLLPILRRYLDHVLERMPPEDQLVAAVRRATGESIREGHMTLARVARKLATTPRTLQRRLKQHGMDFKTLVDDTRRRFAAHYLDDRSNTLTDIAFLVGYSEISAFNRAFKRWTGSTPSEYRRARPGAGT